MKRPCHELRRADDCGTAHADFALCQMEDAARRGDTDNAARLIRGKWLSVFCVGGELAYNWQGGYPAHVVSRETALSVLVHA